VKAAVIGIEGPDLSTAEAALMEAYPPAGVILFDRNIEGALPLARLIGDLREVLPHGARIMVDQEGGRVARLRPPDWSAQPPAGMVGALHAIDPAAGLRLAWLTGALIGVECRDAGFDVVCAPVLDLRWAGGTDAIGDRSYGSDPAAVATLAQSMADGLLSAGIQPVGKHVPGHGQAKLDSHQALPRIEANQDIDPDVEVFARCASLPWLMTAHIVYAGIDGTRPATLSPRVIEDVIRGQIGFDGVLISDDLAMGALSGPPGMRGREAVAAGCDLALYCSGKLAESEAVLRAVPTVSAAGLARMDRAGHLAARCQLHIDRAMLLADQAELLSAFVSG
jgi:beta-N-acetylhexosaminidase